MTYFLLFFSAFILSIAAIVAVMLGGDLIEHIKYKQHEKLYYSLVKEFDKNHGSIKEFFNAVEPYRRSCSETAALYLNQRLEIEYDSIHEEFIQLHVSSFNLDEVDREWRPYSFGEGGVVTLRLERDLTKLLD